MAREIIECSEGESGKVSEPKIYRFRRESQPAARKTTLKTAVSAAGNLAASPFCEEKILASRMLAHLLEIPLSRVSR